MAIVNFTGFEVGDTTECIISSSGTFSIQSSIKRTGTYALRVNPTTSGTGFVQIGMQSATAAATPASIVTSYSRFYLYIATAPATAATYEQIYTLIDVSGNDKAYLFLTAARKLNLWNGNQDVLGTGSTILALNTWYLIELQCGTGASGAYGLKINGVTEYSGTANIKSGTGVTAGNTKVVNIGKTANFNSQSIDVYYDDFAWSDSGYLGAGQCSILLPAANGTSQTFTIGAGSGSHYQVVNEVPPDGDTSYLLSTGTTGNAETESVQTRAQASLSVGTVNSVRPYASIKRTGASSGSVLLRLRSGSTNGDSSADTSGAAYAGASTIFNTDPVTSSAWLATALDQLQVGLVEQSANKTRFSAGYVMVDYVPATPTFNPGIYTANMGLGL